MLAGSDGRAFDGLADDVTSIDATDGCLLPCLYVQMANNQLYSSKKNSIAIIKTKNKQTKINTATTVSK